MRRAILLACLCIAGIAVLTSTAKADRKCIPTVIVTPEGKAITVFTCYPNREE